MKKIGLVLICLFLLVGCSNNFKEDSNKEKISTEIEFFSSRIADLLNNLNNIKLDSYELVSQKVELKEEPDGSTTNGQSQSSSEESQSSSQSSNNNSETNTQGESITVTDMQSSTILKTNTEDIDWDLIKNEVELMNASWSVAMLDLSNSNVSNDDIIGFSNLLNQTIISVKNEDKVASLTNLSNLYSYIPKFLAIVSSDKYEQNIENTKYYVLSSYVCVTQEDWNTTVTNLTNAEISFLSILNDTEYTQNKEFKVNKTYMLIKELQNSLASNDKELYFMKYKNLMESLNTL